MNTKVVNLFAGPGAGKSTTAAGIFYYMKKEGVSCELAPEYAKDLVWEESIKKLDNQIYVFGKQLQRMARLVGKVEYIIADSPIILSWIYEQLRRDRNFIDGTETLGKLIYEEFSFMKNINIFLNRRPGYQQDGRLQNLDEAKDIDDRIKNYLSRNHIKTYFVDVSDETALTISKKILSGTFTP